MCVRVYVYVYARACVRALVFLRIARIVAVRESRISIFIIPFREGTRIAKREKVKNVSAPIADPSCARSRCTEEEEKEDENFD